MLMSQINLGHYYTSSFCLDLLTAETGIEIITESPIDPTVYDGPGIEPAPGYRESGE
jgi:hypothetical protein